MSEDEKTFLTWEEVEQRVLERRDDPLHRLRVWLKWSVWDKIRYFPLRTRWFIQRGRRGYADCDIWSLDSHLTSILIPALERLAEIKNGYPAALMQEADVDEYGGVSEEASDRYFAQWKQMLLDMAFAFRIENGLMHGDETDWLEMPLGEWSEEWYEATIDRWADFNKKWMDHHIVRPVTRNELDRYNAGWTYFREYFGSLWD